MALDEAALDTLGLATLWVRRGVPNDPAAAVPAQARPLVQEARSASAAPAVPVDVRQGVVEAPRSLASEEDPKPAREPMVARAPEPMREAGDDRAARASEAAGDDFEPAAVPLEPGDGAPRSEHGIAALDWDALEARVSACESCRLCERRTNTVFGVGDREADWMLIGEAPGENEDKQGEPFVGQAGKLLDSMLRALSLARGENVYIANVVKCRPPGNRNPEPDEAARCEPYLRRQVALVKPKLIIALGRVAAQNLLKTDASISSLRGRVHRYEDVPVIVTYHPAYLLRSLPDKAKAWVDLCLAHDTYRQALADPRAVR